MTKFRITIVMILTMLVITSLAITSCLVDGSWLNLVGRWQDIEYPEDEIEFTEGGKFYEYFYGEVVGYGEFYPQGNIINFHYLSKCGEETGIKCDIKLKFTVTGDTLIITDSMGDFRYNKVSNPSN